VTTSGALTDSHRRVDDDGGGGGDRGCGRPACPSRARLGWWRSR